MISQTRSGPIKTFQDCEYLVQERYSGLLRSYEELGAKLFTLHDHWRTFT